MQLLNIINSEADSDLGIQRSLCSHSGANRIHGVAEALRKAFCMRICLLQQKKHNAVIRMIGRNAGIFF